MANPRQRRKQRSSISKVSRKSDSRQSKSAKRVKQINGPAAFVQGWDKTKTARQNMDNLGLLGTLDPRQSGGLEKVEGIPFAYQTSDQKRRKMAAASGATAEGEIPEGFARVERDADGKIIRVTFSGGDELDLTAEAAREAEDDTPWGQPLNDDGDDDAAAMEVDDEAAEETPVEASSRKQDIALGDKRKPRPARTPAARALEEAASVPNVPNSRRSTPAELALLGRLVRKYGDDVNLMSRDTRINTQQKTAGQLNKAFQRAGGIEAVRSQLATTTTA